MAKVIKQLAEGFAHGELYDILVAIKTDLEEIKAKYEDHRHSLAGAANTGTAPSTSAQAAGSVASTITLTTPTLEKGMAMGFTGKLWSVIQAMSTDLDEIKAKYEDHRHSAQGDSDNGTAPSTSAQAAGATASEISLTNSPKKQAWEGFGKGEMYDLLMEIKADLEEFKAKYEDHRHSVVGDSSTGTAPSTAADTAGATASEIDLTIE
jgi:hypothetical protein